MVTSWRRKNLDLSGTLRLPRLLGHPTPLWVRSSPLQPARPRPECPGVVPWIVPFLRSGRQMADVVYQVDPDLYTSQEQNQKCHGGQWYYGRILRYHAVSHFSKKNGVAIVVLHGVWMAMDVAQCQVLTKTAEQGGNFRLLLKSKWTALSRLWLKGSSFPPKWFFQNGHGLSTGYWDLDRFGLSTLASM